MLTCNPLKDTCFFNRKHILLGPAMYMSNLYKEARRERSPVRFPVPRDSRSFNGVQNYTDFMRELHSRGAPPLTAMPYPPPVSNPLILYHYLDYSLFLKVRSISISFTHWPSIWLPYFPAHKTHLDFFVRNFRKKYWWMYFNFSNLLEENRIVTYQN